MKGRRLAFLVLIGALLVIGIRATGLPALAAKPAETPTTSLTITQADDGKTIVLGVGDRFLLALGDDFKWTVTISDPSIVRRIPTVLLVRGAQGIYEAERAGGADIEATGVLNCAPGQLCPQLAAIFHVHISVGPLLTHRVMLSQLASDGVVERGFVVTGTVLAGPTCPVERIPPDPRCADRAVSGAEITFVDGAGSSIAVASSDANGKFSIVLPAGRYTVIPPPVAGLLGTAPRQVILINDADIEVTLRYDTGIR
jgi:hypothetical protein